MPIIKHKKTKEHIQATDVEANIAIEKKMEWFEKKKNSIVEVGNRNISASDIGDVILGDTTKEEENPIYKINREYQESLKKLSEMTTEKRAETERGRFKLWYFANFLKNADEILIKKAIRYSKIYFDKYPEKTSCSFEVWKLMCEENGLKKPDKKEEVVAPDDQGGFKSVSDCLPPKFKDKEEEELWEYCQNL